MNKLRRYKYPIIFILLFVISFTLRLLFVLNGNFPFTMDQARDMLDIRNIAVGGHLTLIGPTTSINGVFLGPFYYYFNLIPFLLSGGSPSAILYWQIIWFQISVAFLWWVTRKNSNLLALLVAAILLFSPTYFYQNRYAWTANAAPIFFVFYFSSLIWFVQKNTYLKSALIGLFAGIVFQIEAAFGILLLPFAIIFLIYRRSKIQIILLCMLIFLLTLLPQILFEIRHNFIMSQTFFSELTGKSSFLGDKLSSQDTISSHYLNFSYITHGFMQIPDSISQYIFLIALIYLLIKLFKNRISKDERILFLLSFGFILFAFLLYSLYPYPLKGWYLNGLYIPYALIFAIFLKNILESSNKLLNFLGLTFLVTIFSLNIYSQIYQIPKQKNPYSGDPSNINNEITAIDWVYQKADGQGYKVFSYMPSVYDFPYQYLFWWYGRQKYGYQPTVSSYLEDVPEYIQNNSDYITNFKPLAVNPKIFLIIEKDTYLPKRQHAWMGNFSKFCEIDSKIFPWGTEVKELHNCLSNQN